MNKQLEGRMQVAMVWAAVANTVPAAFWTLYFCLRADGVLESLRDELNKAATVADPAKDLTKFLTQLPLLDSCISEALRIASGSLALRMVTRDTTLKTEAGAEFSLRRGARLMFCPSQLHYCEEVHRNADVFQHDRFIESTKASATKDETDADDATGTTNANANANANASVSGNGYALRGKKLKNALMPFGGGITMCPGKTFARAEIKSFVAQMLFNFDLRLLDAANDAAGPEASDFPGYFPGRAGLGIYPPGKAVRFELNRREA